MVAILLIFTHKHKQVSRIQSKGNPVAEFYDVIKTKTDRHYISFFSLNGTDVISSTHLQAPLMSTKYKKKINNSTISTAISFNNIVQVGCSQN